ncbi:hypothetical protein [Azospirillum argentinense]|uniref:4'-phosphopantetheinyl transferase family protein n=1 Tax=Azospirillum argentinense TaxID=2970906 RepID=UPI0032DEC178
MTGWSDAGPPAGGASADRAARWAGSQLRGWFPDPAFVGAAPIADHPLHPDEAAAVARAVPRRRMEFATGRWLSRRGLRELGLPDTAIAVGPLHNPVWPAAVTGTITHDGEVCAVALARRPAPAIAGIGIDLVHLPRCERQMRDLLPVFSTGPAELEAAAAFGLSVAPEVVLFSLKESVIKAISARIGDFIDPRAIDIRWRQGIVCRHAGGRLDARMHAAAGLGYVLTAALIA